MTELAMWRRKLAKADEWIQEVEAGGGTRKLRSAALQVRKVLEDAIKQFLAGVGPPPLRPKNPKDLKDLRRLVASRYEKNATLAQNVASALGNASDPLHPDNEVGTMSTAHVRWCLDTARQFVDSLEPILANRQGRGG